MIPTPTAPKPLPLDAFPEQLRRNVDPASPPPMRLMAARGLLPAAPREMAMLLYQLSLDADPAIANTARQTLAESPQQIVVAAAQARVDGAVLDFVARTRSKEDKVLEAVFTNPNTPDATFANLAGTCSESISELIAVAEVRLLRTPRIIEQLFLNPNARMSTVDRLIDLAKRNGVRFELAALQHILEDPGYDTTNAAVESASREFDKDADTLFKQLLDESLAGDDSDEEDDDEEKLTSEEQERPVTNLAAKIIHMTISEKMRLAMLGSAAEREFLIKDNNRLVHMAAVTSPKVRLKDVQSWSGNRLVPDSVLSFISQHRRYRRVYQIVVNLVNNPKTPIKDGLRLLPQLVQKDLKALEKNRNVSHQLRRQGKSIMESRAKKGGR